MLTSFDFLRPGEQWPPKCEHERLHRYDINRKLFEGRHELVFDNWTRLLRNDQNAVLEIVINWHRRLSKLWADLLLGEPPRFVAHNPNQQSLLEERYVKEQNLVSKGYELALDISRFGTGLFKVRFDGNQRRSVIETNPPTVWFVVVSPDNVKDIQAHVLAWTAKTRIPGRFLTPEKEVETLLVEIHQRGSITTQRYELKDKKIVRQLSSMTVNTGVNDFLIVPIHNFITSDRVEGIDDYSDLDSIVQEIEIRFAQISRILDKHADPNMYGPDSALELNPDTGEYEFKVSGKYFPVAPGEDPPGYVSWDGKLDMAFKEIEMLLKQLFILTETNEIVMGGTSTGNLESGDALRQLLMVPLMHVSRIRMNFDPGLKKVIKLANQLEIAMNVEGVEALEDFTVEWEDGLPKNVKEDSLVAVNEFTSGIRSLRNAVRLAQGLEGAKLEEELAQIRADRDAILNAERSLLMARAEATPRLVDTTE